VILAKVEQKAEGHCSDRLQCLWLKAITSTGDWHVQQTPLLQKCKKKKLSTKYTANSNSWMASATFEELLVQLDRQIGVKKQKNLALH
jgi:hypothetical protein